MGDIKSKKLLYFKGFLFLFGCIISCGLLFAESPSLKTAVLILIAVFFSARFYYFMFYVIENYIDADYKFARHLELFSYRRFVVFPHTEKSLDQ